MKNHGTTLKDCSNMLQVLQSVTVQKILAVLLCSDKTGKEIIGLLGLSKNQLAYEIKRLFNVKLIKREYEDNSSAAKYAIVKKKKQCVAVIYESVGELCYGCQTKEEDV